MLSVNTEGMDKKAKEQINQAPEDVQVLSSGIGCGILREPVPAYNKADCEQVYKGNNNSWIVLGRDRPAGKMSGNGGAGYTQAGMIDLCVGRMSANPRERDDNNNPFKCNPDFFSDAARIYISQKTDVDANFGLTPGTVGQSSNKSAVALKADAVRIIGREGIKLVTRTDKFNSRGKECVSVSGIDLIAGGADGIGTKDDWKQQPLVKGENLVEALKTLVDNVEALNGIVQGFLQYQMEYNLALGTHFHFSPFFGGPTSPSPIAAAANIKESMSHMVNMIDIAKQKFNFATYKLNYLTATGSHYINSKYNTTN